MAQEGRPTLKAFFENGDFPTEAQFADLIDSTVNIVDDSPPLSVSVNISSAEILALNTTPIVIIPAQGAGAVTRVLAVTTQLIFGATPYTIPGFSRVELHEVNLAGTLIAGQLPAFLTSGSTIIQSQELVVLAQNLLPNVAQVLGNTVGDPTLGDGTLVVKALFQVVQY